MRTIIMAGGKGTRIAAVNSKLPKPMIPIFGKPILEYGIEVLKKQGFNEITIVIGHLGKAIKDYFGDGSRVSPVTGQKFNVNIKYVSEEEPLGTAGALYLIKDELLLQDGVEGDFLLVNGDVIFDIDLNRFYMKHRKNGGLATLFTHPNNHPYDSGIIEADKIGCVQNWLHKEDERLWYRNRVNAGIHFISNHIFEDKLGLFQELKKLDLDREVLKPLILSNKLFIYDSPEYIKDIGTPDRYYSVIEDIESGRVRAKNLSNKQKAIFLDRDGTINKHIGFLSKSEDFELLDDVAAAIRKINKMGFLAIVITNQPVIARGEATFKELEKIHNKMETLLGREGAYLDGIYFCPHHPHKGFAGELEEFKVDCNCRKPNPGMIIKAADDFNIDVSQSWMVGDEENDVKAGLAAGCKTAIIGKKIDGVRQYRNLLECINEIL